jgi:hypothetical protein
VSSHTTVAFRKAFADLPGHIQERAREAFHLFSENPAHPSLQFKQVHDSRPIYSARITLHYRALATRRGEDWIWFWIGSHSDYDNLLKRL